MRFSWLMVALLALPAQAVEWAADLGLATSKVEVNLTDGNDGMSSDDGTGYYVGLGFLRPFAIDSQHHLGMRLQLSDAAGDRLLAARVLDYQYRLDHLPLRLGVFAGAASLDTGSTTLGYYAGVEGLWQSPVPELSFGISAQYGDKLARDKLLTSDEQGGQRPDLFYAVSNVMLFLRWQL
ncbi:MAG: hypothetical protein II007_10910 [Gammaproteobacteria bacterium]|nr:hypothetical protein [Gammaproteobacteria bacterium]